MGDNLKTSIRHVKGIDNRITAAVAGYMELEGAVKDGDCKIVRVDGGISKQLGCCNHFEPESSAVKQFRCGTCTFER